MMPNATTWATEKRKHPAKRGMLSLLPKIFRLIFLAGLILSAGFVYQKISKNIPIPGQVASQAFDPSVPKPLHIQIQAIKVDAPTTELGLNPDGALQVPAKGSEVGWYAGGPRPGGIGPAVMVGHLDSAQGPEVFSKLKNLRIGDVIEITREDKSVAVFQVTGKETYSQNNFPADQVYGPTDTAGLRLITCSGNYSRLLGHYSDNLVVYASLVRISNPGG